MKGLRREIPRINRRVALVVSRAACEQRLHICEDAVLSEYELRWHPMTSTPHQERTSGSEPFGPGQDRLREPEEAAPDSGSRIPADRTQHFRNRELVNRILHSPVLDARRAGKAHSVDIAATQCGLKLLVSRVARFHRVSGAGITEGAAAWRDGR